MRKLKHQSVIHLLVLCVFVLFNNCSGFSAEEINQLQVSSISGASGPTPTPTATPPITTATPTPNAAMTKVFMAIGHIGRTVMSCDDGKTWINDRSDSPTAKCWVDGDPNYVECNHDPRAGVGSDSGDGYFFADYGWGYGGSLRKSRDGINWETIKTGSWGGGVAYANHQLWVLWDSWYLSSDLGANWMNAPAPPEDIIYDHPHAIRLGTKFIAASREKGILLSRDQGLTWERPAGFESKWSNGRAAENSNLIVTIGTTFNEVTRYSSLYSARSTDQGRTWTGRLIDEASQYGGWDNIIFNGQEFVAWSYLAVFKSVDGITWTATPLNYSSPVNMGNTMGPIAFNPSTGTYVMFSGNSHYDQQKVARSTDGINWTFIPSTKFKGGHPITKIIVGEIESKYCP